jgi:predicted nucleic acid-binding protein
VTQAPIVVNDASCLIDLRKARLLHLLVRLPYRLIIPLPVRASELLDFTPEEWAVLEASGMETFDLPPDRVTQAFTVKAAHPKLSVNDCFCLVTTQCHQDATLLTGDGLLRRVAAKAGLPVHGILWVVDEIRGA